MYLDSVSVTQDLVTNEESFFDIMSRATGDQAFTQPCKFRTETKDNGKVGVSIESPSWFRSSEFTSFGMWIAVLLEENLWANYNYWRLNCKKVNPKSLINAEKNEKKNISLTACIS